MLIEKISTTYLILSSNLKKKKKTIVFIYIYIDNEYENME